MSLQLTYWGGESNKRHFAVLVDQVKIAEQELYLDKPGELFEVLYPIPQELTIGKEKIKITLEAIGNVAGGLYYAYTFSDKTATGIESMKKEAESFFSVSCRHSWVTIKNLSEKTFTGKVSFFTASGCKYYEEEVCVRDQITIKERLPKGFYTVCISSEGKDTIYQCSKIII